MWNDPVNLMSYVSYVFQSYFGYSEAKANKLMLEVHQKGQSMVATAARSRWSSTPWRCIGFGLWATVEKATGGAGEGADGQGRNVAKAFKRGLKGITGFLEPAERELLRSLFDDVISMLETDRTGQRGSRWRRWWAGHRRPRTPGCGPAAGCCPNAVKHDDGGRWSSAGSPNAHCAKTSSVRCAPAHWGWTRTTWN